MEQSDMDLSYLNARIRAWNGELIDKAQYDELISATDMKGLTTRLKETIYARDIEIAAARYKNGADILEGGLRGNLASIFKRVWIYAPVSTWGSPYARPLRGVIQQYMRERHLMVLELALDRFVPEHCLSSAGGHDINKKIVRRFIQERIDSINLSTLLKLSGEGLYPANMNSYFLEGGNRIDRDDFLKLAKGKDRKELLQGLIDGVKDRHWRKIISAIDPDEAFFLEEQLEELTRQNMCKLAVIEPLSIALAICFIYKKIREIKNLRLIIRAKVFDMPAIEVKRFII